VDARLDRPRQHADALCGTFVQLGDGSDNQRHSGVKETRMSRKWVACGPVPVGYLRAPPVTRAAADCTENGVAPPERWQACSARRPDGQLGVQSSRSRRLSPRTLNLWRPGAGKHGIGRHPLADRVRPGSAGFGRVRPGPRRVARNDRVRSRSGPLPGPALPPTREERTLTPAISLGLWQNFGEDRPLARPGH
jgi:hypothetical protein